MLDQLKNVPVGAVCRSDELLRPYQVVEHQQLLTVIRPIGTDATARVWSRIEVTVVELPEGEDDWDVPAVVETFGEPLEV